jgi:Rieske Fe-S protein
VSEDRDQELVPGEPPPDEPWREQFPYHWDADEAVNRREFVRIAVLTSGALFAGTVGLAFLGKFDDRKRGERKEIAKVSDVKPGSALYFNYPGDGDQAMLLRLPDGEWVAYSQKCTHLSCAVYYQPEKTRLFCPCHDGVFDPATGGPTAGPPQRRLPRIVLEIDDNVIYAMEMEP